MPALPLLLALPTPSEAAAQSKSFADKLVDFLTTHGIRIVIIIAVAVVVRYVAVRLIGRLVARTARGTHPHTRLLRGRAREVLREGSPLLSERRRQRTETIGSVLRSMTTALVYGIAFVDILAEIGVNIAPVITSAGILGVAIGFGAQSLVSDFLSGIFMLLEDQYGVGDVIDVGPASGNVEAVGLRVTRIRDVNGVVWYMRNGQINRVANKSQNWSRALIDVGVAYSSDIPKTRAVIKRVADSVWHDPNFAAVVLEEPEVWGVEDMQADGIVIRLVVKTAPLEQWRVARELRERIKGAFDVEGIEIPFPQRSIWVRTTGDKRPNVTVGTMSVDRNGDPDGHGENGDHDGQPRGHAPAAHPVGPSADIGGGAKPMSPAEVPAAAQGEGSPPG